MIVESKLLYIIQTSSIFFLLNLLYFANCYSQDESVEYNSNNQYLDSLSMKNFIDYGINKQQNVYNYLLNFNYKSVDLINFEIKQLYNGNTLISSEKLSKDDEYCQFILNRSIIENLALFSQSNYILINYPSSNELSRIERINSLIGLNYFIDGYFDTQFLIGPESNSQIGYNSSGTITKLNTTLKNIQYDDFLFNFNNNIELLQLDKNRLNKDVLFNSNISKDFGKMDKLFLDFRYKLLDRYNLSKLDSLYVLNNMLDFGYSIENRLSNSYNTNLNLDFLLFDRLKSYFKMSYDITDVTKSFNQFIQYDNRTSIIQSRKFQKLFIDAMIEYNGAINQKISFNYDIESELNSIAHKYTINESDYRNYENLAFDLNFDQTIFSILGITSFKTNSTDSIEAKYSSSIKRFDTPSLVNNSDRDELLSIVNLNYYIKLNRVLDLNINTELQLYHQVNLKSALSASNYWMRTIKLGPQFIYKTNSFFMRPNFSILANYVVYDFELNSQNIRSYSIRQITYNDSLDYKLNKNFNLSAKFDIIYKETGLLYWNNFEELPINGNFRLFSKFFVTNNTDNYSCSIGARYYNLSLNNFSEYGNDYVNLSYGPEVSFIINFSNSNKLEFNGWYEFQFINKNLTNEIPNFFIKSLISL